MRYGIINVPVTDIRAEPDSKSERLSQALFGMAVEIGESRDKFSRVTLLDKYTGWSRTGHISLTESAAWEKYISQPKQRVKADSVLVKSGPGLPCYPFRLFFGTELVTRALKGQIHFEIPADKIRAPICTRCLQPPEKKDTKKTVTGKKLVATASRFIGSPYLWGGLTPFGYDCSGLVQMVYGFHGLQLPRDSKDQRNVGQEVGRDSLQPGDLLFFPGHVAISCGGSLILHASAGRGMVTFDSLDPNADNYREDLDKDYQYARRLEL